MYISCFIMFPLWHKETCAEYERNKTKTFLPSSMKSLQHQYDSNMRERERERVTEDVRNSNRICTKKINNIF